MKFGIYPKLEDVQETKTSIWVPAFEKKVARDFKSIQLMSELQIQKNDIMYKIQQLYEMSDLSMMYDQNYKNSFKIGVDENDVIIKKNFVIGKFA